jgi:ABC transport system ATP-binding/permease protein
MNGYPAIFEEATKKAHALPPQESFLVGRSDEAHLSVLDVGCSRRQFQIKFQTGGWILESISTVSPTYCDGQVISEPIRLRHGSIIQAGNSRFIFLEREDSRQNLQTVKMLSTQISPLVKTAQSTTPPPQTPSRDVTIIAGSAEAADLIAEALPGSIPVQGSMLIGREANRVQVLLQHPHVSRFHAQLVVQGGNAVLTDLSSANGTFVKGKRITEPTRLRVGDRIEIGPFSLVFTGPSLVPESRENNIELIGRKLRREVPDRQDGKMRVLLHDVSVVIRPHEFVCLLGPSGSGKSTLLSALSARVPADDGQVLVNSKDLYTDFDSLKQDMVVVPQKDALYESLTVDQCLWYTARLRLPSDTSDQEVQKYIDEMLKTVSLTNHRQTRIRDLSGGQLKRASLASELISGPTLLFLDEVTSGLDEQTDREMMDLFRSLANAGKTVVCITHSLANVERTCHLVVILAAGGRLAFIGKPEEALAYFEIVRLGDVYEKLALQSPEAWQKRFQLHQLYQQYVVGRLPESDRSEVIPSPPEPFSIKARFSESTRQLRILLHRQFAMLMSDKRSWLAMMGQAVLVGILLILVFGDLSSLKEGPVRSQRLLALVFLIHISVLWFGCNNAAKEIVKERVIYRREHDFNLHTTSYFLSKFILLSVLTCLQSIFLFVLIAIFCNPSLPTISAVTFLLLIAMTGVAAGLAISAYAKSEDLAVTLVPILLIPQIILAGRIAPLEGFVEYLAKGFITAFWSDRGLVSLLNEGDLKMAGIDASSTLGAFVVLGLHLIIFAGVALFALRMQTNREGQISKALMVWLRNTSKRFERTDAAAPPPSKP